MLAKQGAVGVPNGLLSTKGNSLSVERMAKGIASTRAGEAGDYYAILDPRNSRMAVPRGLNNHSLMNSMLKENPLRASVSNSSSNM